MPRWIKFAIPYLLFLAHAYSVFGMMEDDSYITLRYAANLVAGHGAVYNIGERVEGYTSILHMLLDAAIYRIMAPTDPMFVVKLFSTAFGLLTVWAMYSLARTAGLGRDGAVAAQTLVALSVSFALSSVNGLETTLYTFLLTIALTSVLREVNPDRNGAGYASGLLLFVATLARPDGLVIFGSILAVRFIAGLRGLPSMHRNLTKWALAYTIPIAAFYCVRYAYYGSFLPNTYYAKVGPIGSSIRQGLIYLAGKFPYTRVFDIKHGLINAVHHAGVAQTLAFATFALLFWMTTGAGLWAMRSRPYIGAILTAVVVGQVAFIIRAGGDWMPSWRFIAVVLPVISIAQTWNIAALREGESHFEVRPPTIADRTARSSRAAALACVAFVVSVVACECFVRHPSWGSNHYTTVGRRLLENGGWGRVCTALSSYVKRQTPPGSTIATSEVGYVAFANLDHSIVDMRGLTDATISHLPLHRDNTGVAAQTWYVPGNPIYEYFKRRHPDYIITFYRDAATPNHPLDEYDNIGAITAPVFYDQGAINFWVYRWKGVSDRRSARSGTGRASRGGDG